jgi:hypothetical protein
MSPVARKLVLGVKSSFCLFQTIGGNNYTADNPVVINRALSLCSIIRNYFIKLSILYFNHKQDFVGIVNGPLLCTHWLLKYKNGMQPVVYRNEQLN